MDSKSLDDHLDGLNDYDLLYSYIHDQGLVTDDRLLFHGDVELAKKYDDTISVYSVPDYNDLYSPFDFSQDELNGAITTHREVISMTYNNDVLVSDEVRILHQGNKKSDDNDKEKKNVEKILQIKRRGTCEPG